MLRKVKGLILKDYFCAKHFYSCCILMLVSVGSLLLSAEDEGGALITFMPFVFTALMPNMCFSLDKAYRFNSYAATLPVTRRGIVQSKYLLMVINYSVCFIVMSLMFFISTLIHGTVFNIAPIATYFAVAVLIDSVFYACLFRFGIDKGSWFLMFLFIGGIAVVFLYLLFGDLSIVFGSSGFDDFIKNLESFGFMHIFNKLWLPVLIAAGVFFVIGYKVSCVSYHRGLEIDMK
ncbi:MAG: ABC-2 transporter permease [Oscillospiraceae bacterium]|nr:ABC-2 transporter permease [Oscillospiraceae bacterium]